MEKNEFIQLSQELEDYLTYWYKNMLTPDGGGIYPEICPYRCMKSILHARRCKAYYGSCNVYYGWCGGYGGGYGYGHVSQANLSNL